MENTQKIKKTAFALLVVVSLIMLYNIIITIVGFVPAITEVAPLNPVHFAFSIVSVFIMLSVQLYGVILLLSVKKDETPFNSKNVRLLKSIAILLVAKEPLDFISSGIPVALGDGTIMVTRYFPSGAILAAGIVVYCIALVFKYGITLQTQFDETL
jgi:hypothetical protein